MVHVLRVHNPDANIPQRHKLRHISLNDPSDCVLYNILLCGDL